MNFSTRADVDVSGTDVPMIENIHAVGTQWRFGELVVGAYRLEALGNDAHPQASVQSPQEDSINVVFILKGAVHVTVDGSTFVFVAGAGLVLPTNELPAFFCIETSDVLAVSLKGAEASALFGMVPNRPTAIAAAVIATHPALEFLLALVATAERHPIRTPPAGVIIAKLIASLLDADQDWHTRPHDPKVSEVLTLIDRRHTDPTFDAKAIARHFRATLPDLELLLDGQYGGRRPSDVLLERRLVSAMTLLHPDGALSAEQIAFRSGFASVTQLDEAIDGVYGLNTETLLAIQQPA